MNEITLKGIPASAGVAYGSAFILDKQDFIVNARAILEKEIPIEIARFEEALMKTREEILEIQKKISDDMGMQHARIFDAHLLVLEDRMLIEQVIKGVRNDKMAVEYIFSKTLQHYAKVFSNIQDEYLRERKSDVMDVGRRILKNLVGESKWYDLDQLTEELVIIAHDLSPSDTASMYSKHILAFATDIGGQTSHTAIMAKSMGIPAVVGLKDATLYVSNQDFVIVDGRMGLIIINPTEATRENYRKEHNRIIVLKDRFVNIKDLPAETTDGRRVEILANLELPEEIPTILKQGAPGIGLYRTEYFYMNRMDLPTEDVQFAAYKHVAEAMAPYPVTIRTLDLGGDKFVSSLDVPKDMSPFMGWRAIRFCLARPDIFQSQIRAILRASAFGKLKMMYPMISGVVELRQANVLLNEVKQNLRDERIPFDENIEVGCMIETPSAAVTADILAKESHFFSIGTNDLIQYTLAVDRANEKVANLYEPGHPAILRLIKGIIDAAHAGGIKAALCGEISGDPVLALILLGLGLDEFSTTALSVLQIKQLVRSVSYKDAQEVARRVLELSTGTEVEEFSRTRLKELAPHVISAEMEK